jgi:pimeloyl-ACP methyl ester carboxylesterase
MVPEFAGDLYDDALLCDPYPAYRMLRDLGSAVWMPRWQLWAVTRFDAVRQALRAAGTLVSGQGVAANDPFNHAPPPITLTSDGETHHRRRRMLIQPVMPPALKALRPRLEDEADRLREPGPCRNHDPQLPLEVRLGRGRGAIRRARGESGDLPRNRVPTITLEGDANGAPHPEPAAYAKKFTGPYEHRTLTGGIGHNLPQEAPSAFAQAILDVDRM